MRQFRVVLNDRDIVLRPGVFIIGRGRTADLMLHSPSVSRKHAMLRISLEEVSVEDIGSRNGVLVNGHMIEEPTALRDGDCIEVGGERIHLVEGAVASSKFARPTGPPTSEFSVPDDLELGPDERTVRVTPFMGPAGDDANQTQPGEGDANGSGEGEADTVESAGIDRDDIRETAPHEAGTIAPPPLDTDSDSEPPDQAGSS